MPPLQIPGYYYDQEKKKYFKIEKAQTAPAQAEWSSEAVKRRKTEAAAEKAVRRRREQTRRHVRRDARFLPGGFAAPGMLGREIGGMGYAASTSSGRSGAVDVGVTSWAGGISRMGSMPFGSPRCDGRNLSCLWVGGGEGGEGDPSVVYTTLDEETLTGSYIPKDSCGRIRYDADCMRGVAQGHAPAQYTESVRCSQLSSIQYHKPSHRILLTSREPDHSCGLFLFSPTLNTWDNDRPSWLLGETNFYQRLSMRRRDRGEWIVHRSAVAHASSDLLCVMATNVGVVRVASNEDMSLLSGPSPIPPSSQKGPSFPKEVLDVDFMKDNHNVVLAGGRSPRLWISDMRSRPNEWSFLKHTSSIARLRSVNEHQVVVSGLQSSMALYDIRYLSSRPNGFKPLLRFPSYQNEAHIHVGFDVCPELGAVAAAQENGTVGVYSLASGRRVHCEALNGVRRGQPVRSLMFAKRGRETMPSLYVGEGMEIVKYAFGVGRDEEEEG